MTRLLIFIFLSFVIFSSWGANKPQRIASMSLCSDELVLLLSDYSNIVSLSYLTKDPRYSSISTDNNVDLTEIYLNQGQAEEIISLEPDLVLSSRFSANTAINLLQSNNYPVTTLGFPTTLDQTFQQIKEVATLLHEKEQGNMLIQKIQNRIGAIQSSLVASQDLTAVFYADNGFSFGANTLRHDFLNSIGIKNLAAEQGIIGSGKLSIELLISEQPDFLLIDQAILHNEKLAQPLLQHPILKQYFPAEKIIVLPNSLFQCAGPGLIEAYEIMALALDKI
ncbi:MAG: ABC transporter substrate-binding protein [Pseudohongiellaceae bacterium]